jgi:mannitol-specific phosphotransferase system IIBC component
MKWQRDLQVLLCAVAGGVIGHFAFVWLISQGFYAMILPGGLIGLAAGIPKYGKLYLAILCAVMALVVSLYSEWRVFPFIADESFSYFLKHVTDLKPMTWLMIAVGTGMAFWVPFRRSQEATRTVDAPPA